MANKENLRDKREDNSEQVEIEPSESKKSGGGNKSGDPGRTPGKAEGEDESPTTESNSKK